MSDFLSEVRDYPYPTVQSSGILSRRSLDEKETALAVGFFPGAELKATDVVVACIPWVNSTDGS